MWRVLGNIFCNNDPRVKVKSVKAGICDGVSSVMVYHRVQSRFVLC